MPPFVPTTDGGTATTVRVKPLTLAEEIEALGVSTYHLHEVRRYMRRTLHAFLEEYPWMARLSGWRKLPLDLLPALNPPESVLENAHRVAEIPDVEVYAMWFEEDPIMFAKRGDEKIPFDAWDAPGFPAPIRR
jgi:hypothetical protein